MSDATPPAESWKDVRGATTYTVEEIAQWQAVRLTSMLHDPSWSALERSFACQINFLLESRALTEQAHAAEVAQLKQEIEELDEVALIHRRRAEQAEAEVAQLTQERDVLNGASDYLADQLAKAHERAEQLSRVLHDPALYVEYCDDLMTHRAEQAEAALAQRSQAHQQMRERLERLPAQIMNIRADNPESDWTGGERGTYRIGHRDARHAAAELVTAALAAPPQDTEAMK